jgi:hypothetical protein
MRGARPYRVRRGAAITKSGPHDRTLRLEPLEERTLLDASLPFPYVISDAAKDAPYVPAGGPDVAPLVLAPRGEVIDKIVLRRNPRQEPTPRITAVTCLTSAASGRLSPLPDRTPGAEEAAWLQFHAITPMSPDMQEITAEIRRAHKLR